MALCVLIISSRRVMTSNKNNPSCLVRCRANSQQECHQYTMLYNESLYTQVISYIEISRVGVTKAGALGQVLGATITAILVHADI